MRSQGPSSGQPPTGSLDQKKSVFDRLGRQIDASRHMKRRGISPPYVEYMPNPPVHDTEFGRFPRDPHSQAELEWRYQNERRHMSPFPRDGRHPMPHGHGPPQSQQPPPPMQPNHFDIEMGRPPYYPGPNPYHVGPQPGPPPPPMGPGNIPMMMQRSSPKYDRHGNPIISFKDRSSGRMPRMMSPMEHQLGMPPRNFMPNEPMMHDLPPNIRPGSMYPQQQWHEEMDPNFQSMHNQNRMLPRGGYNPVESRRYGQPMMNNSGPIDQPGGRSSDLPKYTKWRERRNVITNLDRETAQSSSRTDSLKSTLQQPENRIIMRKNLQDDAANFKSATLSTKREKPNNQNEENQVSDAPQETTSNKDPDKASKSSATSKTEPQDISDGEIVDDEDSSDESESGNAKESSVVAKRNAFMDDIQYLHRRDIVSPHYNRTKDPHHYYEPTKKRRMLKRDDYAMDYETISDDDLDNFMDQQKDLSPKRSEHDTLGLDWANLVEIARQSKTTTKDTAYMPGSALSRFYMPNYLPTLGITQELAGIEIFELIGKLCGHH